MRVRVFCPADGAAIVLAEVRDGLVIGDEPTRSSASAISESGHDQPIAAYPWQVRSAVFNGHAEARL